MGAATNDAARAAERFDAAHRALRGDGSIQFDLPPVTPPPATPAWLKAFGHALERLFHPIGRFLAWIGHFMPDAPYARIVLWTVLALVVAAALWLGWIRLRHGEWRLPRRRRVAARSIAEDEAGEDGWVPDAAPARALLAEADALAAQDRFAEAVHLLLIRSVEEIQRRRPQLVRPALTSRDLAAIRGLPGTPRMLFAGIARVVERSLFGGRPVGADDWQQCRAAYADFALPRAWAR